jgi:fucose permease
MNAQKNTHVGPMIIIGGLFFIFGFVTWLNGPLITFVKLTFNLQTDGEAFWVTFAFYMDGAGTCRDGHRHFSLWTVCHSA